MYRCMKILGQRRAETMIEMVREATGKECPCLRDLTCPYFAPVEDAPPPTAVQEHDPHGAPHPGRDSLFLGQILTVEYVPTAQLASDTTRFPLPPPNKNLATGGVLAGFPFISAFWWEYAPIVDGIRMLFGG